MTSLNEAGRAADKVSYKALPHKGQLAILLLARITETLASTAIQSCVFFQLRHFDPIAGDAKISTQAGLLVGSKTAAHVCTGMLWGRLADSKRGGRKLVLVIGLLACGISVLGYGLSQSFASAFVWQLVDGLFNSSISMVRCMTSELYPDKRYRARALTLLPLITAVGMFLGPLLGGFLAVGNSKDALRNKATHFSFALPSIVIASYTFAIAITSVLWLVDHPGTTFVGWQAYSGLVTRGIRSFSRRNRVKESRSTIESEPLLAGEDLTENASLPRTAPLNTSPEGEGAYRHRQTLHFHKIWTAGVINTMLATFLIAGHLGTFTTMWPIFLSAPIRSSDHRDPSTSNSGGLAMDPRQVAIVMSLLGSVGILLQVMVYPSLRDKLGTIKIWRSASLLFPLAYCIAPFCALGKRQLPKSPDATDSSGATTWVIVTITLLLFIAGRTGVTPATTLLINECTPHPSTRATIHTTGTIVGNLGRSIFPAMILPLFGHGLKIGVTGLGFWCLSGLAALACIMTGRVTEENGGTDTSAPP